MVLISYHMDAAMLEHKQQLAVDRVSIATIPATHNQVRRPTSHPTLPITKITRDNTKPSNRSWQPIFNLFK